MSASGQYTEIINSKRPGLAESPYGVGTHVLQIESGFFYRAVPTPIKMLDSYGSRWFVRYGALSEKLEFNLSIIAKYNYQSSLENDLFHMNSVQEFTNKPLVISDKPLRSEGVHVGVKYLLYQQKYTDKSKEIRSWKRRMAFDTKRLIPSVGLGLQAHIPQIDSKPERGDIRFDGAVLLQQDFSDRWILLTNFIVGDIKGADPFVAYLLSSTYAFSDRWSYFIENKGTYRKNRPTEFQWGTGLAFLCTKNLQLDVSASNTLFENNPFVYGAVGISWRLDWHRDKIIRKEVPTQEKKRRNFFRRLFKKKS